MREPIRTCTGCRRRDDKRSLVRIVRSDAAVIIDERQTAPGRGAYLHRDPACLDRAVRKRALGRALRSDGVGPEDIDRLRAQLASA